MKKEKDLKTTIGVCYSKTINLRFKNQKLQQMWQGSDGSEKWENVETIN